MVYSFTTTGKDKQGQVEIMFTEGPFEGYTFILGGMKFADEPNDDGTINMSFDYEITNDREDCKEFQTSLGELLMDVLETQIQEGTVVYEGGDNEGVIDGRE